MLTGYYVAKVSGIFQIIRFSGSPKSPNSAEHWIQEEGRPARQYSRQLSTRIYLTAVDSKMSSCLLCVHFLFCPNTVSLQSPLKWIVPLAILNSTATQTLIFRLCTSASLNFSLSVCLKVTSPPRLLLHCPSPFSANHLETSVNKCSSHQIFNSSMTPSNHNRIRAPPKISKVLLVTHVRRGAKTPCVNLAYQPKSLKETPLVAVCRRSLPAFRTMNYAKLLEKKSNK